MTIIFNLFEISIWRSQIENELDANEIDTDINATVQHNLINKTISWFFSSSFVRSIFTSLNPLYYFSLISKDQVFVKMFNTLDKGIDMMAVSIANKSRANKSSSFPRHGYTSTFKITDPDVTRCPGD